MRRQIVGVFLALAMILVASCAPRAEPAAKPAPQTPAAVAAPAPAATAARAPVKQAWEADWEKAIEAAKKEGKVIIDTAAGGGMRLAMQKIAEMQGIHAEVISMRTAELFPKILGERRAGLYLHDIISGGTGTLLNTAKPAGILERLDSALILPEVTDPKKWFQGELPWVDKDHTVFAIALQPGTAITVNTNLVKEGEIKSWRDLLDPKWSGKLALNDPTVSGYGSLCVQVMLNLMGEDYLKDMVKAKPIIIRDQRQLVDWLAHGKVAIAVAAPVEILVEFVQVGAPIKPVVPQEGTWLGAGNAGVFAGVKNFAHPNASKVFINWFAGREAQDIFAPALGVQSTRVDVSTAHLLPGLARTEGVKYFPAYTEEYTLNRGQVTDKLAKELFGPLAK